MFRRQCLKLSVFAVYASSVITGVSAYAQEVPHGARIEVDAVPVRPISPAGDEGGNPGSQDDELVVAYVAGTAISVDVRVINDGPGTSVFHTTSGLAEYELSVTGPRKDTVPLTRFGKKEHLEADNRSSSEKIILRPKREHAEARFLISRYYDMSLAGDYTITVARLILENAEQPGGGEVKRITSSPITVRVTQPSLSANREESRPSGLTDEEWQIIRVHRIRSSPPTPPVEPSDVVLPPDLAAPPQPGF